MYQYEKDDISNLKFTKDQDPSNSAWIGASMLGSLSTFQNLRIKKSEYEELGEHRMCFISKRTF